MPVFMSKGDLYTSFHGVWFEVTGERPAAVLWPTDVSALLYVGCSHDLADLIALPLILQMYFQCRIKCSNFKFKAGQHIV